jgi:hypothetical protein
MGKPENGQCDQGERDRALMNACEWAESHPFTEILSDASLSVRVKMETVNAFVLSEWKTLSRIDHVR